MNARAATLLLAALAAAACAPAPRRANVPLEWVPSPNFDERRPQFVIIHHTSDDTAEQALRTLTDPLRQVSAHYLVGRDGKVWQLVDERERAWHAGDSKWGSDTDINSASIGIELDNDGEEPFADAQITALLALLADIEERYHIPQANFLGHADVAPRRKVDPSRFFPWRTLAEHGFGLWCDPPYVPAAQPFDTVGELQALGYDVSDPRAAAIAFNRHYAGTEEDAEIGSERQALLQCLVEKARSGE